MRKVQASQPVFRDPVCGMEISRTAAIGESEHQGKIYYFCSGSCEEAFEAEPERYLRTHRQHGMKPAD